MTKYTLAAVRELVQHARLAAHEPSVVVKSVVGRAGCVHGLERGVVVFPAQSAAELPSRAELDRVERVQTDRVGFALRTPACVPGRRRQRGRTCSGRRCSRDRARRRRPSVGANCSSLEISIPALAACRTRPVANRAATLVWFDRMWFSRSFPCRARFTTGSRARMRRGLDGRDDRLAVGLGCSASDSEE